MDYKSTYIHTKNTTDQILFFSKSNENVFMT